MHIGTPKKVLVVFGLICALLAIPGMAYGEETGVQSGASDSGGVVVTDGSDETVAGVEPAGSGVPASNELTTSVSTDIAADAVSDPSSATDVTGGSSSSSVSSTQSNNVSTSSQSGNAGAGTQLPVASSETPDSAPTSSDGTLDDGSTQVVETSAAAAGSRDADAAEGTSPKDAASTSVQDPTADTTSMKTVAAQASGTTGKTANTASPSISYSAHVQNVGWQGFVSDGRTAGTTGKSLRLEALKIQIAHLDGGITYSAHVQNIGWQNAVANGHVAGTTGRGLRLEALEINLTGAAAKAYDVYYRTHVQNYGWMGWASNGAVSGSVGLASHIEALQIKLLKKGAAAPSNAGSNLVSPALDALHVACQGHSQNVGWQSTRADGGIAGTTGRSLRLEALRIDVASSLFKGGVAYQAHVAGIGWQAVRAGSQVAGTTGQYRSIEALCVSLSGELAKYYNVYYRAHVKNHGWLGWASNGGEAGSTGRALQVEAVQLRLVPKGMSAPDSTSRPNLDKAYIYLDAGHGNGNKRAGVFDSGATGCGYREYDLNADLVNRIASVLKGKGVECYANTDGGLYTKRHAEAVSRGCSAFVSIHFNAGGGTGSESYIAPSGSSRAAGSVELQRTVHPYLIKGLGLKDRGMKSEDFAVVKGALPAMLLEIAFIDNASDMSTYQARKQTVAEQLAAGIIAYAGTSKPHTLTSKEAEAAVAAARKPTSGTPIMGLSQTTVSQMVACFNAMGKPYPASALSRGGAPNITQFCTLLYNEANDENVRAEVVFSQAMLETGWLQYGGDVKVGQFNFAGLGATGKGVPGNSFKDVATGLRAQVQHLKAYASTAALNKACVDQRFGYVKRGCATTVEQLSQKWATGADYGNSIKAIMNQLSKY